MGSYSVDATACKQFHCEYKVDRLATSMLSDALGFARIAGLWLSFWMISTPLVTGQVVTASKWDQRRKLYPELVHTFDLAESAPTPLRALALARIAESLGGRDLVWKRELLEESFQAALESPVKWPVDFELPPAPGAPVGTKLFLPQIVMKASVINSGLDRLSIQASVARQMLAVDRQEARALFAQISITDLLPLSCSDVLIPDLRVYYRTAAEIAMNGFTLQEKKEMEHEEFLRSVLTSVSSAVEVGPAAQMLFTQRLSAPDVDLLAIAFSERLQNAVGDNRSFFGRLDSTSSYLMSLADSLDGSGAVAVLKGWRKYLIANLSGVRCQDTTDPSWPYMPWATEALKAFNDRAKRLGSIAAIGAEDVRPAKVDYSRKLDEPASLSRKDKEWFERGISLGIHGDENDADWLARFDAYLNAVENLEPTNESDEDIILEKCRLLRTAAVVAPPGTLREKVLRRYVQLLKISNPQPEVLPAWYYQVHQFFELTKLVNNDEKSALTFFEGSGDPLLNLVAELRKLESSRDSA